MNPQAGIVLAMMAGLWIAYLVPHRLRTRQEFLEARQDDRFSADLRVLRAASAPKGRSAGHGSAHGQLVERPVVLVPRATEVATMSELNRSAVDVARRSAAERSQRAAQLARRAAAARRRGLLMIAFALATVAGWVVFGTTTASIAVGIVPTVLLVAVVAASRAAAASAQRADAEWAARARIRAARDAARATQAVVATGPSTGSIAVGQAVHPSEQLTEFITEAPVARAVHTSGQGIPALTPADTALPADQRPTVWEPRPVPAPAYTLKPTAPRRVAAPLEIGADGREVVHGVPAADLELPEAAEDVLTEPDVVTTGSMDLNQILARRRASGL